MRQTNDRIFSDSNILLYLLSDDERKKAIAKGILHQKPIISTQVLSENVNVLSKKFRSLSSEFLEQHIYLLAECCHVSSLTFGTVTKALELKSRYGFQWYDCTILSSAILNDCNVLFSEDMQHNMLVAERLRIINPFL